MPKFGQKWPKMPQNATKSNLLGLYPKFLLPSFVDNQKSPFCVDDVAQFANAQKNKFLGGIIIIQSFCQLHVWTPNTFHGRNMVRRDPVFSSKKHAQGAERALLL